LIRAGEMSLDPNAKEKVRILVVEDEGLVSKDIQESLKSLGYAVCGSASAGEEAIRKAEELRPDLILMDIILKGDIDGVEAAELIHTKMSLPVVFLTAHSDDHTLGRAKVTEPFGYILKPFDERELHTTIEVALYKHRMDRKVRESEQWFSTTLRSIGDAVIATDTEGRVIFLNAVAERLTGWSHEEASGRGLAEVFNVLDEDGVTLIENPVARVLKEGVGQELRNNILLGRNEHSIIIDDSAAPIIDDKGQISGVVVVFRDVTERRRQEEKIKELHSLLMAIREIDESLLRVKSEPELFQQICDSLLKVKDFKLVTIGVADNSTKEVKPVAASGKDDGFVSLCKMTADESEVRNGPAGLAIRSGDPVVVRDIDTDPVFAPWRGEALKRGYLSTIALPLRVNGDTIGSLSVYAGQRDSFSEGEVEFLTEAAGDIGIGVRSLRLEKELAESLVSMRRLLNKTVEAIAFMTEMRDPYTAGHQRRVAQLACAITRELGYSEEQVEGMRVIGFLHDVGKIVVPAEILSKPGKINEAERAIIKTHSQVGYDILKRLEFPWPVARAVLQHHERLDGSGYPSGIREKELTLEAGILAVSDVVESMASHRPYREALGIRRALEEISLNRGTSFMPQVVDACLRLFVEKHFEFER
jgi:PAS domain S-box-containing protein/putative nucleotidyltransferase with HDIG domain